MPLPDNRRSYDRSFKINTVRKLIDSQHSVEEVARELGIPKTNLFRWKHQYRNVVIELNNARKRQEAKVDDELDRLKNENADLKNEVIQLRQAYLSYVKRNG